MTGTIPLLVGPVPGLAVLFLLGLLVIGALLRTTFRKAVPAWLPAMFLCAASHPLVAYAAGPLSAPSQTSASGKVSAAEGGDWPLFRGDLQRRGFAGGPEPVQGRKVWSFQDGKLCDVYSSPAVAGNRVYATFSSYSFFGDQGSICCLDANSGELVWSYGSEGVRPKYRSTFSSPAVSGKYLVVGEGLHLTKDARVFCLDRQASERQRKGVVLWEYRTSSHVEATPCIIKDSVVIGAGDDGVYCFALEPDAKGLPRVLWRLDANLYPDCEVSPACHDGRVYMGLGRFGGQAVVCVDAETGKELWRVKTPSPVTASPAIAGGCLYVGMGFGDYLNSSDRVAAEMPEKLKARGWSQERIREAVAAVKREGEVWCIGLDDHEVKWKHRTGQIVLATPAVDGNEVWAASRDGKLHCLSADKGDLLWSQDFREALVSSPAVGRQHVYVVTNSGRVCGIRKDTRKVVWDVRLNTMLFSSPAIGQGHLYVGANGAGLLCLGQPARPEGEGFAEVAGTRVTTWDGGPMSETGDLAWSYAPDPNAVEDFVKGVKSPAACREGAVYFGMGKSLAKLDCGAGPGGKPRLAWQAKAGNDVWLRAAPLDKSVFFVDGKLGDSGRQLHCVDPRNGGELWQRPVEAGASGEFVVFASRLMVAENSKGLTCLDVGETSQCKVKWQAESGPTVGAPALREGLVLAACVSPARLVAFDAARGQLRWQQPLPKAPITGPVIAGGRVYVAHADGLAHCSLSGKDAVKAVPCGSVRPALAAQDDRVACVTQQGAVYMVDGNSALAVTKAGAVPEGASLILTDEEMLFVAKGAIQRYDRQSRQTNLWAKTDWMGKILMPMIAAGSYVIFLTEEEGLVCMRPRLLPGVGSGAGD